MNTIFNHKSIRQFQDKPIDDLHLTKILEAGTRASNTGNMQMYSMIVTQDKVLKEKLCAIHFNQKMVNEAPVCITFCVDTFRFSQWCKLREADPGYDNFLWFCCGFADAMLAAQNIAIAAEFYGYGICFLGTAMYNADQLVELLDIPKGVVPALTMVIGHPKENAPLVDRLPLEAVVHYDKYNLPSETDIDKFYKNLEDSELTRHLLSVNQKKTLAQVFTDNRYTKKDNIFISEKYLAVIRKQGFNI